MSEMTVSKRYAEALFLLGQEKNSINQLKQEFSQVQEIFENNSELRTFLMHPRINNTDRKKFIEEVFQSFQKDVVHTLKLLVDRQRTALIPDIIEQFIQFANDAEGIALATVYTARTLTDAEKQQLEQNLKKRLNKQTIQMDNVVDPELIGGVKIRIGNTIYDGSISGKLRRIEQQIVTANN